MRKLLQMPITLSSGLSTVCNINITPSTAPTVICQTRFTTTTETARHTIGRQQRHISADTVRRRLPPLSTSCSRSYSYKLLRLQWATARQH